MDHPGSDRSEIPILSPVMSPAFPKLWMISDDFQYIQWFQFWAVKSTAWWFQPIPCEATGLFSRDAPHRYKEGNWLTFLWERINLPPQNGNLVSAG